MKKNFHENDRNFAAFAEEVTRICDGLTYVSETDAPIELFKSETTAEVTSGSIAAAAHVDRSHVEEVSFDAWFNRITEEREWWSDHNRKIAKRFVELRQVLEKHLRDLKVFRFGVIRIDVFVVGRDVEGRIAGVRTRAVET